MTRLALCQGARLETMMGLAGLGDLVLTCTGALSRNRRVGFELGRGTAIDEITSSMRGVAEGIKTTAAVHNLAMRLGVEMPITEQVRAVVYDNKTADTAVSELMARPLRDEA
jgi:glycerol-3-phosphate dehydrogenase (NAD(P)+)